MLGDAEYSALMAPAPKLTQFHRHSNPQSSGSVDSGGGVDGQASLTSLLPQGGVDDLGSSGGGATDMQGTDAPAEDVNKHREKNRNAQV